MLQDQQHPCVAWCAERLYGLVENQRSIGKLPDNFKVEVLSAIGPKPVPKGSLVLNCQHGLKYVMRRARYRRGR